MGFLSGRLPGAFDWRFTEQPQLGGDPWVDLTGGTADPIWPGSTSGIPQKELERVVGTRAVWTILLRQLLPSADSLQRESDEWDMSSVCPQRLGCVSLSLREIPPPVRSSPPALCLFCASSLERKPTIGSSKTTSMSPSPVYSTLQCIIREEEEEKEEEEEEEEEEEDEGPGSLSSPHSRSTGLLGRLSSWPGRVRCNDTITEALSAPPTSRSSTSVTPPQ
ncbi:unnamed protein product [Pleuronectes platessa]|uniref:Uncharacterized protein n=1 Tax=Pleuronectes platessa TaxID=8262 RepID=A0A9N7VGJ7_PLEPL|nr:unnamed protein product [Pleuronectes platessa]